MDVPAVNMIWDSPHDDMVKIKKWGMIWVGVTMSYAFSIFQLMSNRSEHDLCNSRTLKNKTGQVEAHGAAIGTTEGQGRRGVQG
jgi:hypothetical protein